MKTGQMSYHGFSWDCLFPRGSQMLTCQIRVWWHFFCLLNLPTGVLCLSSHHLTILCLLSTPSILVRPFLQYHWMPYWKVHTFVCVGPQHSSLQLPHQGPLKNVRAWSWGFQSQDLQLATICACWWSWTMQHMCPLWMSNNKAQCQLDKFLWDKHIPTERTPTTIFGGYNLPPLAALESDHILCAHLRGPCGITKQKWTTS